MSARPYGRTISMKNVSMYSVLHAHIYQDNIPQWPLSVRCAALLLPMLLYTAWFGEWHVCVRARVCVCVSVYIQLVLLLRYSLMCECVGKRTPPVLRLYSVF